MEEKGGKNPQLCLSTACFSPFFWGAADSHVWAGRHPRLLFGRGQMVLIQRWVTNIFVSPYACTSPKGFFWVCFFFLLGLRVIWGLGSTFCVFAFPLVFAAGVVSLCCSIQAGRSWARCDGGAAQLAPPCGVPQICFISVGLGGTRGAGAFLPPPPPNPAGRHTRGFAGGEQSIFGIFFFFFVLFFRN